MNIKITNYKDAKEIIGNDNNFTKIISIIDTEKVRLINDNENQITGIFLDNLFNPTKEKVFPLFDFFNNISDNDNVLIHCSQGISRSTAIAFSLLLYKGYNFEDAMKNIYQIRPQACPNDTIIKLIDEYLNLDGKIYQQFKENKYKDFINNDEYEDCLNEDETSEEDLNLFDDNLDFDDLKFLSNFKL